MVGWPSSLLNTTVSTLSDHEMILMKMEYIVSQHRTRVGIIGLLSITI